MLYGALTSATGVLIGLLDFEFDKPKKDNRPFSKDKLRTSRLGRMYKAITWHYFQTLQKASDENLGIDMESKEVVSNAIQRFLEYDNLDLEYAETLSRSLEEKSVFYFPRLVKWMTNGAGDEDVYEVSIVLGSYINSHHEAFQHVFLKYLASHKE